MRFSGRVVDVDERIDARLRIGFRGVRDAVDHAARAARRGDLARLHDVERKGVVGLVARAVGDGRAGRDAQLAFRRGVGVRLNADRNVGVGDHRVGNAVPVGHEVRAALLLEIPENLLRKAAYARGHPPRKTVGDVVAREHELVDFRKDFGLVALHPRQFRRREVARRIEGVFQAELPADPFEGLGADPDGPGVAPDDRLAQRFALLGERHESVHLVGDADGRHLAHGVFHGDLPDAFADVVPPHFGVLLGPAAPERLDGHLRRGVGGRSHAFARRDVQQRHLDGR